MNVADRRARESLGKPGGQHDWQNYKTCQCGQRGCFSSHPARPGLDTEREETDGSSR